MSASVLAIRPTGVQRERQSELALRVLFAPEGQPIWEADSKVFAYPEGIAWLQVGSPIWARYLRDDRKNGAVLIEKDEEN